MAYPTLERGLDVIVALVLGALTLPVWLGFALVLRVVQGASVVYRQARVGRHGAPFVLLKFRTMRDGSSPRRRDLPVGKLSSEPRVTTVGHWLRRWSLNELPQPVNVLRGELSLVGRRPFSMHDLQASAWMAIMDTEATEVRCGGLNHCGH